MSRHFHIVSKKNVSSLVLRGSQLGVCMNGSGGIGAISDSAAMGFHYIRADAAWSSFEGTQGVYTPLSTGICYQIGSTVDDILTACMDHGMHALLTWYLVPSWARSSARPHGGSSTDKRPPDDPATYANSLVQFLSRYQQGGARASLGPAILAIEVWNEPNWYIFWKSAKPGFDNDAGGGNWGSPNVSEYRDLFIATYNAVRAAGFTVPLVTGGVAGNVSNFNYSYQPDDFVSRLFTPSALLGKLLSGQTTPPPGDTSLNNPILPGMMGGVGTHAYGYPCPPLTGTSYGPRQGLQTAGWCAAIATQFGVPLWNTEWGIATRDQGADNAGECTRGTNLAGYSTKLADISEASDSNDQTLDTWFGIGTIPNTSIQQYSARYLMGPSFYFCYGNMGSSWSNNDHNFGIYYDQARYGGAAKQPLKDRLIAQCAKALHG